MKKNKFYIFLGWFTFLLVLFTAITLFYLNESISPDHSDEDIHQEQSIEESDQANED